MKTDEKMIKNETTQKLRLGEFLSIRLFCFEG